MGSKPVRRRVNSLVFPVATEHSFVTCSFTGHIGVLQTMNYRRRIAHRDYHPCTGGLFYTFCFVCCALRDGGVMRVDQFSRQSGVKRYALEPRDPQSPPIP